MSLERSDKTKQIPECPQMRGQLRDYCLGELVRIEVKRIELRALVSELEAPREQKPQTG
jgi:hypothetical protein